MIIRAPTIDKPHWRCYDSLVFEWRRKRLSEHPPRDVAIGHEVLTQPQYRAVECCHLVSLPGVEVDT